MTDKDLLQKMGLSDDDLRDLLTKTHHFVQQLNPAQQQVFKASQHSFSDAAATFGSDVTGDQLSKFLSERAPKSAPIFFGYFAAGGHTSKAKS